MRYGRKRRVETAGQAAATEATAMRDAMRSLADLSQRHTAVLVGGLSALSSIIEALDRYAILGLVSRDNLATAMQATGGLLDRLPSVPGGEDEFQTRGLAILDEVLARMHFLGSWEGRRVVVVLGVAHGGIMVDTLQFIIDERFATSLRREHDYHPAFEVLRGAELAADERAYVERGQLDAADAPATMRPAVRAARRFLSFVQNDLPSRSGPGGRVP